MNRPYVFPDNFHELGRVLFQWIASGTTFESMDTYRKWFDFAPDHASVQDLTHWGRLLTVLLDEKTPSSEDARRLKDYLNAMTNLPSSQWSFKNATPDLKNRIQTPGAAFGDLLRCVCEIQGARSHPIFRELVSNGWSFDPLVEKLTEVQALVQKTPPSLVLGTTKGALFRILWPLMHDTDWRPSDNGLYADMLVVNDMGASQRDILCAAHFSKSVPSQNTKVLEKLLYSTNIGPADIALFFPMDVSKCEAFPILDTFVGILTEGGRDDLTYKARIVSEQLHLHNPELSSLLQMHLTLFPEANELDSMAEMLVPAFNTLYGRVVEPAFVLGGDFFDEGTGQPNGVSV